MRKMPIEGQLAKSCRKLNHSVVGKYAYAALQASILPIDRGKVTKSAAASDKCFSRGGI